LFVAGLAALLSGPTPGATGACGGDPLEGPADVIAYCMEKEELGCERRRRRGEIDEEMAFDCRRSLRQLCARRFWPADCRPSRRTAQACLNALHAVETLHTPEDEIEECQASKFCSIRTAYDGGEFE
jgi:hypothetical protein